MDDPNITMEEYIRLEEEKARKSGKVFNWETAKYGKIWYDEDIHNLRSVETEFPAIAFNDGVSSGKTLSCESTVSPLNDEIYFRISLTTPKMKITTIYLSPLTRPPPDIVDFKMRLARIYRREVHRVQVFDFGGLSDLMAEGLSARMLMEHRDAQGVSLFTSQAWRRLFDIRGPLVHELILEFLSTFRFGEGILDLDTPKALRFQLGGARHRLSWRQFIVALGLHMGEEMESPAGYFLGTTLSYTSIRNLILRLCHRLIACSIAGRSQTPEKVIVTDLFYLRGMDVGSVNVPYLLATYLRLFAVGRKSGALISGEQFVARLTKHFGLLTEERLGGLTDIAPALPVIDMDELVRLQICIKIDDTWDWVALGPERQPDVAAGAPGVAQDASVVDEGDQAVSAPVQAPQPPPAAARTMPQRMVRLEEDVHEICRALAEQREVIGAMARDFSRFTVWVASGIAQLLDSA
ncbi:hypothetical protein Tco_1327968 [Tanacetum coccineum]